MTTFEREQFRALSLRQARLEEALAQLRLEFRELEQRAELSEAPESAATLPPLPVVPPPIPVVEAAAAEFAPLPEIESKRVEPVPPPFHAAVPEQEAATEKVGLEFQFGRWLARIGVVFALITLISFSTLAYEKLHHLMGPWSKLGVLTLISVGLVAAGLRIERKNATLTVYGRTLAGGGLACLYYTLYGASYVEPLQVIHSHLLGGILLLGWSGCVLYLAEAKKSELLSIFAIALAYFSSAITPVGGFTMVANLLLSATAVIFLVRNAWTGLSYLCLFGTYVGLLRQFVVYDSTIDFWFELIHGSSFWPAATYLAGAWVIYTAAVFLATTPNFAAGKRMAFLCLNNGALIGLLTMVSTLSGYGHIGSILGVLGGVFIATSYLARSIRAEASEVAGAYLMQGLALATGGVAIAYSGVTRGLLITVESVFLAAAGAHSRNAIFRVAGYVSAFLGASFLLGEIVHAGHLSWVLPFGGALAMLANAWLARREFRLEPREISSARFVGASAYYSLLALVLMGVGIPCLPINDAWIAPDLAITALVLTFVVYLVSIFELPLLSQVLLLLAQVISIVPALSGPPAAQGMSLGSYPDPQWSQGLVALVTMILVTWWPRQKLVRTGFWLQPLLFFYALAMSGYCYNLLYSHASAQSWMITGSLLSLAFLAYGTWTRSWQFMASGQVHLALAVWTFFTPPYSGGNNFPWSWWAAAIPPAVLFATGWLAHQWLPRLLGLSEKARGLLSAVAYCYQALALGLVVRWIFGIVPTEEETLAFFVLAMGLLLWNVRWPSAFGTRASLVVNLIGAGDYLSQQNLLGYDGFTWSDAAAFSLFLAQPALLRRWGRELISELESWAVIVISAGMAWIFVSNSIHAVEPTNLTLGWAIFALVLTIIGFAANERRQRWCGLVILVASIVRVGVYDFWGFSDLYKVLTFFALTVICLGLSFLYYKFADRLKEWL